MHSLIAVKSSFLNWVPNLLVYKIYFSKIHHLKAPNPVMSSCILPVIIKHLQMDNHLTPLVSLSPNSPGTLPINPAPAQRLSKSESKI